LFARIPHQDVCRYHRCQSSRLHNC
jgi:hypothetical protein